MVASLMGGGYPAAKRNDLVEANGLDLLPSSSGLAITWSSETWLSDRYRKPMTNTEDLVEIISK